MRETGRLVKSIAAIALCACASSLSAQTQGSGIWVNPKEFRAAPAELEKPAMPPAVPTENKGVYAIASAIGGQLSYVVAKQQVGSHLDPYERTTLQVPDYTLDAIVMRGLDRVIGRRFPQTERVYMRLNPSLLNGVPPHDRERIALERLTAELQQMPQRAEWDRIVIVTPHYRGFERAGLASKLQGVGVFVQGVNADDAQSTGYHQVIEPDGTPGARRRNNFIALYYYAKLYILDAKTLQVLESSPWLIDEKIYNSSSDAINIAKSLTIDQLSGRLEMFAEKASTQALSSIFGGIVEPGDITPVPPSR